MEILRVEKLCKVYGTGEARVDALKEVSFSLEKGEFAAVIGEDVYKRQGADGAGRTGQASGGRLPHIDPSDLFERTAVVRRGCRKGYGKNTKK